MSLVYEAMGLKKYYGKNLALDLPHFKFEKGDALILQGPNGSGKSTFLRILAYLEQPSEGVLHYLGNGEPRRECTLLLQEPWLVHATVFQNVALGLKIRGEKENLKEKFRMAMSACGFENPDVFAQRKPVALSGGEKQRICLASRLILKPNVLLLDEPTAYVDAKSALCIINALQNALKSGISIICATHDHSLAAKLNASVMELGSQN